MGYAWSDMSYQEKKAAGGQAVVFGMSLLFVFLILAAMYESWSLPFSVLLSTPVAVLGAYGGLLLRKFDNNVFAQIGLVMLIGLTAKNAILIVEFAKLEHDQKGKVLVDAALEGARLRLRPILMTSFAFILGCVPLWTAKGAGAIGRQVMGTAVIVGMLAATILGVFIVPVLFVVVERLGKKKAVRKLQSSNACGRRSGLMRKLVVLLFLFWCWRAAPSDRSTSGPRDSSRPSTYLDPSPQAGLHC